jgi:hypothetical protein
MVGPWQPAKVRRRYVLYLQYHDWVGDIMVEERFKKVDKKLKASVERIYFHGTEHLSSDTIQRPLVSKDVLMRPKQANIAGLQLADSSERAAHAPRTRRPFSSTGLRWTNCGYPDRTSLPTTPKNSENRWIWNQMATIT